MFWERFFSLCQSRNVSPNAVCSLLDLSSATATHWKNGSVPKGDILIKIADYFDCSVDYLLGRANMPNERQLINDENNDIDVPDPQLHTSMYAIGYVDILGASKMMKSENSDKLLLNFKKLIDSAFRLCESQSIEQHIKEKMQIKVFSDNIMVAIKCDDTSLYDSVKMIIFFLSFLQFNAFLLYSLTLRGCVLVGKLYIDKNFVYGSGIVDAYKGENELALYPRIIIEKKLAKNILDKKQAPNKILSRDTDGFYYINYLTVSKEKDIEVLFETLSNMFIDNKNNNKDDIKIWQKLKWTENYFTSYFSKYITVFDINPNKAENIEKGSIPNYQIAASEGHATELDKTEHNEDMLSLIDEQFVTAQQTTDYDKLDIEDKAEIRGMIKQMLKSDKYKKTDSYAQSVHDFDNALDITPLFEKYKVNKD